jgi:branched-chain amino acid transport system substrate-binding protein
VSSFMKRASLLVAVGVVALVVAACGSSSDTDTSSSSTPAASSGSSTTAAKPANKGSVKVAMVADLTGPFGPNSGSDGMLAYFDQANANGGIDGYKIDVTKYDAQSTPAGALQAFRKAIADKPAAIISATIGASSAIPTLAKSGIPGVGEGFVPGWTGHDTLFSPIGDVSGHLSDVWMRVLKDEGATKLALLTSPIEKGDTDLMAQQAGAAGVTVAMKDTGLPQILSSADALSIAQRVKSSGADGVLLFGLVGGTQIQANLNQLGVKAKVLETSEFGPEVLKQYGPRVNDMLFAAVFTSPYVDNTGTQAYTAAMKKYGYEKETYMPYSILRYAQAKMLVEEGLKAAGAPFDNAAVVSKLAALKDYTGEGLLPKTTFPDYQQAGSKCLSVTKVQDGKWVAQQSGDFPYVCGGPSLPVPH